MWGFATDAMLRGAPTILWAFISTRSVFDVLTLFGAISNSEIAATQA